MDLLLRVEARVNRPCSADVCVTLEPSHTVAELTTTIAGYLAVPAGPGLTLVRASSGIQLDPRATIDTYGVLSGEHLILATEAGAVATSEIDGRGIRLEVTGGPSAGFSQFMTPGRYTLGRNSKPASHVKVDDESISGDHFSLHVSNDLEVTLREKDEALNKATLNGAPSPVEFVLTPHDVVKVGATSLTISPVSHQPGVTTDALGHLPFYRTPRRPQYPRGRRLAALGDIPARPDAQRLSVATVLLPLGGGVAMAAFFNEPRFLVFIVLTPLTALLSWLEGNRAGKKKYQKSVARFTSRLEARKGELDSALRSERAQRLASAPDTADLLRRAQSHGAELWHRGRQHLDFLALRVGVGDVSPLVTVEEERGGEEEHRDAVAVTNHAADSLVEVPVTLSLREFGVVALHGDPAAATNLTHSLLMQAVCLHSPEDLVVVAAVEPGADVVDWLKWTPHTRSTGSPLAGPHLAQDKAAVDALLAALLEVAKFREHSDGHGVDRRWPWILVALDRRLEPEPALVSQLLDLGVGVGISVLWMSDRADRVPPQARVIIDCQPPNTGELSQVWFTDPEIEPLAVDLEGMHGAVPEQAGRALAPLRDASSSTQTAAIPRISSLFSTLGIEAVSPTWIKEQWAKDRGYAVTTTIGVTADGPLELDLVEHGPHALIGGTSGAGKSELLQSLVAGLIASHSPKDVNLLFVDFKGGSASEPFKDLPHVVGRVTDLDESLALRAQTSIRAELRRRVGQFSTLGVKDLREMRDKHLLEAPPSLVIVIDEFATLVKELPDFVAGLVDIAQRGRSYGIHLILATQRPSAAVDDNILANTNLRISLRMLDSTESSSVIGSPDAAQIPVPLKGRALARLGPGQLVEFQSAFSGAPLRTGTGPEPVRIRAFDAQGATEAASTVEARNRRTQLSALTASICKLTHQTARQIWSPLLPPGLPLQEVRAELAKMSAEPGTVHPERGASGGQAGELVVGRHITLGKLDDPGRQQQYPAVLDLETGGGVVIFGVGGSGKTSALRTIAISSACDDTEQTGAGLSLFVLDFGSGALAADLAHLPQCAAVATAADPEATTRILATLDREIGRRRSPGTGPGGREGGQRTIVLVDNYAALVEALLAGSGSNSGSQEQSTDEWLNTFLRVVSEGRQVGIHVAIGADRASSLRSSLLASITTRVVLRQADDAEARELGAPSTRTMPPGGGYLGGLRLQVAHVPEETVEVASHLRGTVAHTLRVPALPADILVEASEPVPFQGVLGLGDLATGPVRFDLTHSNMFVYGPPQSGRSWALLAVAQELVRAGHEVYAVGPDDSGLRGVGAAETGWGVENAANTLGALQGKLGHARATKRCVLVFDDLDLMDHAELYPHFDALLKSRDLRIVASAATVSGFYSNKLIQELPKRSRQLLYLQPGSSREVADFVGLTRLPLLRVGLDMPPGRGLFVANRRSCVVQVFNATSTITLLEREVG